jgi:hypothetical protein
MRFILPTIQTVCLAGFTILILVIPVAFALAHGTGESFEAESNGYLVDVGYSVSEFNADSSVVFDFGLKNEDGEDAKFSDVWVRVVRGDATVFAGGVHNARFGGATMTYTFPSAGEYELSVRFQEDGKSIAESSFPLVVEAHNNTPKNAGVNDVTVAIIFGALGVIVGGAFIRWFISRREKVRAS